MGIFVDLSKAFDTINHKMLLDKLEYYGIKVSIHLWISSYLHERQQYVLYYQHQSKFPITCWMRQGSIIGPALSYLYQRFDYLIYFAYIFLFAYDTNIFYSVKKS